MLTEKCPHCGSFNDVNAAECYFCHKDLPDTPGHKKQRKPKKENKPAMAIPPSIVRAKKKNPPGCLMMLVIVLFLACLAVVFQTVNASYHFFNWQRVVLPPTDVGRLGKYYLDGSLARITQLLEYPIIAVTSGVVIVILGYGLLNMRPWARVLALILWVILTLGNIALFILTVMNFYFTPYTISDFVLILSGLCFNIYTLVWLFEHKKSFE
jgi:hypothetical protein